MLLLLHTSGGIPIVVVYALDHRYGVRARVRSATVARTRVFAVMAAQRSYTVDE